MHQLGRAARSPFAEIVLFEQQHIISAGRRVNGAADAGSAAANDDNVPRLFMPPYTLKCFLSIDTAVSLVA